MDQHGPQGRRYPQNALIQARAKPRPHEMGRAHRQGLPSQMTHQNSQGQIESIATRPTFTRQQPTSNPTNSTGLDQARQSYRSHRMSGMRRTMSQHTRIAHSLPQSARSDGSNDHHDCNTHLQRMFSVFPECFRPHTTRMPSSVRHTGHRCSRQQRVAAPSHSSDQPHPPGMAYIYGWIRRTTVIEHGRVGFRSL